MSQMNSRRQELLSRLKTTLAIVSQATGFDNERPAGDARPAEQQWSLGRDPRVRRQENYQGALGASEPGTNVRSGAVTSTARTSAAQSSSLFQKYGEIQDEDEFLYGSTGPAHSDQKHVLAADSGQDKRSDDQQDSDMRLQWVARRPEREEDPRWTGAPRSHEPSYSDLPQAVSQHADDPRSLRNTEPTAVRQTDQSRWMEPSISKGDDGLWGGTSSVSRYPDVDYRLSIGKDPNVAASNVGLQPESIASKLSKLQGINTINTGMLEGILNLVASGTSKPESQPHQQPLQQQPQTQLLQPQQPIQQQQQPLQQPQQQLQPQQRFESQHAYGRSYPPQNVYSQFPDQRDYISSGVPHHMSGGPAMYASPVQLLPTQLPQSTYSYNQPALQQNQGPDPLFSQLASAFLDSRMVQTSGQRMTTGEMPSLAALIEQVSAQNSATSYRPAVTNVDSHLPQSQHVERLPAQPAMMSYAPEKPQTGMQEPHTVGRNMAEPPVASQTDRPAAAEPEPDKSGSELPKRDVDKDTLSRLLKMIGNSSVTSLMQELLNKDEQDKAGKQQTIPEPNSSAVPPTAQPPEPQVKENDIKMTSTVTVLQTQSEPAVTNSQLETKPEHDNKPKAALPAEPAEEPAKESKTEQTASSIEVLSSLLRVQKNYDSPDENADKHSGSAAESGSKILSAATDVEWERSTAEFLRRLQSKPAAPVKSQKEKSRSTSREKLRSASCDKTTKISQKMAVTEGKTSVAKQSKSEIAKVTDGNEIHLAETENERADLLKGKGEIENALELIQKELTNLRANKKRLLESPSGTQRDAELEKSIENERNLSDHMSQLKTSMVALNQHLERLEKLSSVKVLQIFHNICT